MTKWVRWVRLVSLFVMAAIAFGAVALPSAQTATGDAKTFMVVFKDDAAVSGLVAGQGAYSVADQHAISLVQQAGGTVTGDFVSEIGVVQEAGEDFSWKGIASPADLVADDPGCPVPPPKPDDPDAILCAISEVPEEELGEHLQWDMQQICAIESTDPRWATLCDEGAHAHQKGNAAVDVGILDSGIDGRHVDLMANVRCERGRDSVFEQKGLLFPDDLRITNGGLGLPDPCVDNQFHGTHVAGTVAADDNTVGIVGVAPDVSLIPVKVCDTAGYCYASAVVDGILYAGHQKFDVINMSFFVDDEELTASTMYKCSSDPVQRAFRHAVERAIQFARNQGVTPVAALGNSDQDLAHPPEPYENECDVVPAETQGVIGTMALGRDSQKASYSNYGSGMTDVAAPGGSGTTGDCRRTILSTVPGNLYLCIQGTSMASPHSAGVAALIVSEYGTLVADKDDPNTDMDDTAPATDVSIPPQKVENYLQSTTIDLINSLNFGAVKTLTGFDECFGHGRIDARRAVLHETASVREVVPVCAEGQD
jgi:subtilisin family serine protease